MIKKLNITSFHIERFMRSFLLQKKQNLRRKT
nr:MAG TPA: hypothetical protein [Bacteriophage sp.]DAW60507.1 MAG TPA: hypothetical protein [Caudoviricetes sp.]